MLQSYHFTVLDRFLRYVQVDTQSNPHENAFPSSEKQKILGQILVEELKEMGVQDAHMDRYGYVYAHLLSRSDKNVPALCFCAHLDTSPDCPGNGVKPIVHKNYDGKDLPLPDDPLQVISPREHPYLLQKLGDDIVTASGTTLLGADDKAGIAVIMDLVHFLLMHPEIKHGPLCLLFTPDEEIGRGVDKLDFEKLGAVYGYTLDAGELGTYEDETFSADGLTVTVHGVSAHPGYAKDKLVNAIKVAAAFIDSLPREEFSPESTDGRYGFVHPVETEGGAEKVTIQFIIRDFTTSRLAGYEEYLRGKLDEVLSRFPGARADFVVKEQYRNMKEILDQHPQVSANALEAIRRAGLSVRHSSARGGTDGSRMSFLGLPCPNLFTGEMAFHSRQEYVSVQDMQKSVETLVHLVQIWEENARV
jgi:tripeptide aminopeptidase